METVTRNNALWNINHYQQFSFRETSQNVKDPSVASSDEPTGVESLERPAGNRPLYQSSDFDCQKSKISEPPTSSNHEMVLRHWLEQLKSIPNMITVSRILVIPFISYWIITQQPLPAIVGCIYAAISDVLDGFLARRYPHMQTALGTYLDPLADKFFINALSISLWINGTLPGALMGLWLMRDVVLMAATHRYVAQNTAPGMTVMDPVTVPLKVTPTTISKVNTALQFVTLTAGIISIVPTVVLTSDLEVASLSWNNWFHFQMCVSETVFPALCWITGTTTILSFLSYWGHSAFVAVK